MSELVLERRNQDNRTPAFNAGSGARLMITPKLGDDYWAYRVLLSERQAIVGFPKFVTVCIGFAVEEDWNANLPYRCEVEEIFQHIKPNKGDDAIADDDVRKAIEMVRDAATADMALIAGSPS